MKVAIAKMMQLWYNKQLDATLLGVWHDETQSQVLIGQEQLAGEAFNQGLQFACRYLSHRCPLVGEWKHGPSWKHTHQNKNKMAIDVKAYEVTVPATLSINGVEGSINVTLSVYDETRDGVRDVQIVGIRPETHLLEDAFEYTEMCELETMLANGDLE